MLQGKLIRLRSIEERDLDRYYNWINEPELARLILGTATPCSREQVRKIYHSYVGSSESNILFTFETLTKKEPIGF
jgi:hypothetical protein